jgi:hypothetical protein
MVLQVLQNGERRRELVIQIIIGKNSIPKIAMGALGRSLPNPHIAISPKSIVEILWVTATFSDQTSAL